MNSNFRIYSGLIPILILSAILIAFNIKEESCSGLVEGLRNLFILGVLVIASIIVIIKHLVKISRGHNQIKHRLIFISLIVLNLFFSVKLAFSWKELFEPNPLIKASIYSDQLDIGILELYENNKYKATFGHIDWSCSITNSYELRYDTLFLNGEPILRSGNIISNVYLLSDSTLVPIPYRSSGKTPEEMKISLLK